MPGALDSWTFGLREGVLILIALVAIYMLIVLWRMRRVVAPTVPPAMPSGPKPAAGVLPQAVAGGAVGETAPMAVEPNAGRVDDAWQMASAEMAEGAICRGLEQEVAQLREEVEALRSELAALRGDLQQELTHLRATQTVSPIYGDAMQLAGAGYDAETIAERCGIARAEAELVVALARSQEH